MAARTLTLRRGKRSKDVTVTAGTTIAGGDAVQVNYDQSAMSRKDVIDALDEVKRYVLERPFPTPTT